MSLDVFAAARRDALDLAGRNLAPDLPATFSETFDAALRTGLEFGNSVGYQVARRNAIADTLDGVRARTGVTLPNPNWSASLDDYNTKLRELKESRPDVTAEELTPEAVDRMTLERMKATRQAGADIDRREHTWGGAAGGILGGLVASTVDPINIALAPLGGMGAGGFLIRAGEFAAIGAGGQAVNEIVAAPTRERAVPGSAAEAGGNIATAGVFGAGLGVAFHGAGLAFRQLGRLLGIDPTRLPTSVRDDLSASTSASAIDATNVLPGLAGEAAHRDGLTAAVGQIARGERVTAADLMDPAVRQSFRESVQPILDARTRLAQDAGLPSNMERLSEMQLADLRGLVRRVDAEHTGTLNALTTRERALATRESGLPEREQRIAALTGEADGLRMDRDARVGTIPPATLDEATLGRIAAIEDEMAGTITAKRRAALEAERDQIGATVSARVPEHASVAQEILGLTRALESRVSQARQLQAKLDRSRGEIETGRSALQAERREAVTRAASRRDVALTELRRGLDQLAQQGYGLRLADGEAETLAARIAAATDQDAPAVLRGVTEEFATRPRTPDNVLPRRPVDVQQWRDALQDHVQAFTRSHGHDLGPEELRGLTDHLVTASPAEVEARLGEFLQRPVTFGDDLAPPALPDLVMPEMPRAEAAPARMPDAPLSRDLVSAAVRDGGPETIAKLRSDSAIGANILHDFEHIRAERPDAMFREAVTNPDGSVSFVERRLDDVWTELEALETGGRNLEACLIDAGAGAATVTIGARTAGALS